MLRAAADRGIDRVGTTLLAAAVGGPLVTLVHIGDSRAYRLTHVARGVTRDDERLDLLTHDHNVRAELLAAGLDVRDYRERGVALHGLTSFIGLEHDMLRSTCSPSRCGPAIASCSAPTASTASSTTTSCGCCSPRRPPGRPPRRWSARADRAGGRDNSTAVVVEIGTVEGT